MTEEFEFDTYLIITNFNFEIYLYDKKNLKSIYEQKLEFQNELETIDLNYLNRFLESNIFKIEKLTSNFINNIFIVVENQEITDINMGIKKKKLYQKFKL